MYVDEISNSNSVLICLAIYLDLPISLSVYVSTELNQMHILYIETRAVDVLKS